MRNKNLDQIINSIISKYIKNEDIDRRRPISLNIQFSKDSMQIETDLENLVETKNNFILTMYAPYSINELRFNFISNYKLVIRSFDYDFYKQFWFSKPISKESLKPNFRNNVLEIDISKKEK